MADQAPGPGVAFAALRPLFTIDQTTGRATLIGIVGTGLTLTARAAGVGATATVPEPSSLALLTASGLGRVVLARRRRTAGRRRLLR